MKETIEKILPELLKTVFEAGSYASLYFEPLMAGNIDRRTMIKEDGSPVTTADLEINKRFTEKLHTLTPDIPVVSEEATVEYSERKNYDKYWVLDPIDGTQNFIDKSTDFTLNIALVEKVNDNYIPTFGIIYAPISNEMYWGGSLLGFSKKVIDVRKGQENIEDIIEQANRLELTNTYHNKNFKELVIAAGRKTEKITQFLSNLVEETKDQDLRRIRPPKCTTTHRYAKLAENMYDIAICPYNIKEWDFASGHAIIEGAKGKITNLEKDSPLSYNSENMCLESFVISRLTLGKEIESPWEHIKFIPI